MTSCAEEYEKEEGEIDDDDLEPDTKVNSPQPLQTEEISSDDDEDRLRHRIRQLEDYNHRLGLDAVTVSSTSDNDSIIMIKKRRSTIYKKTPSIKLNRKRKRFNNHQHVPIKNRLGRRFRKKSISPDPINENYTPHTRRRLRNAIRVSSSVVPDKTSLRNRLNAMLGKKTEKESSKLCIEETAIENGIGKVSDESDDELEALRQMALDSKTLRPVKKLMSEKGKPESDEEIDANELRIIALRSAVQKTMQKKGYPKRLKRLKERPKQTLSQLFSEDMIHQEIEELYQNELDSEFLAENGNANIHNRIIDLVKPEMIFPPEVINNGNSKIIPNYSGNFSFINGQLYFDNFQYINPNSVPSQDESENVKSSNVEINNDPAILQDDHLTEDDERALREQLLSSMKHMENKLTDQPISVTVEPPTISPVNADVDEKSKYIIRLGESDSESDCEEIKNLTKMHKKLTDSSGFQDQLEVVLKTIRCNVEKAHITVKQNQEKATKNSLSAVRKLPRTEQKEYLKLVSRMRELEKKKLANQTNVNTSNAKIERLNEKKSLSENSLNSVKSKRDIIEKPQNLSAISNFGTALNQHMISLSENIKSQNKIVQQLQNKQNSLNEKTELLKAKLRAVHVELQQSKSAYISNNKILDNAKGKLIKMRKQLKILDNRLKSLKYKPVNSFPSTNIKLLSKENVRPTILNKKVPVIKKTIEAKVTIVKDCKTDLMPCECSIVKSEKSIEVENIVLQKNEIQNENCANISDYKSPLFSSNQAPPDPQSIFCPYEIGGSCKDTDCKYFHPK